MCACVAWMIILFGNWYVVYFKWNWCHLNLDISVMACAYLDIQHRGPENFVKHDLIQVHKYTRRKVNPKLTS